MKVNTESQESSCFINVWWRLKTAPGIITYFLTDVHVNLSCCTWIVNFTKSSKRQDIVFNVTLTKLTEL